MMSGSWEKQCNRPPNAAMKSYALGGTKIALMNAARADEAREDVGMTNRHSHPFPFFA